VSRLSSIRGTRFDIAIVGGGIIGAGIARDAALRGLTVALFEKHDYGWGTTSGSTRLIHGGLRYLEMLDFKLVRLDLRERETLLRIAPHLVKPLEFLVPFYSNTPFYRAKLRAGMILYDLLSYDKSLPRHRMLSARETLAAEPLLRERGLQGAASYYDAQIESPERLTVENITDARDQGAQCFNYAEVTRGLREGDRLSGLRVRDVLTGEDFDVRARVVVNASGAWFDRVAGQIEPHPKPRIRTTKGIHLACPNPTNRAVVLFSEIDKRLFFVIPLRGFAWIGTTDTDFTGDPGEAAATPDDIDYLVRSARAFVPAIDAKQVFWTNSGVRALVMQPGSESSVSRMHRIDTAPGLVSVLGGKITGYRAIAQDATDAAARALGAKAPCVTAERKLPGKRTAREEQCEFLTDFMMRRTSFSFTPDQGRGMLESTASALAAELGWSAERRAREIDEYLIALGDKYTTP
jgi:glycerol-3-phosphate dehydrogenase